MLFDLERSRQKRAGGLVNLGHVRTMTTRSTEKYSSVDYTRGALHGVMVETRLLPFSETIWLTERPPARLPTVSVATRSTSIEAI